MQQTINAVRMLLGILLLTFPLIINASPKDEGFTLQGTVTDATDGSELVGVTIYISEMGTGAVTDIDGHYIIHNLPNRKLTLQVSYVGHQTIIRTIDLNASAVVDFVMRESNAQINEVIVTGLAGQSLLKDSPSPITLISAHDLHQKPSANLIDAIASQPGVAQITTGSGIAKPVIRGLGYNRLQTVNMGIRQEGQQWGDEHGIEIDEFSVGSVEILKGPASLRYGSDAMAGVVIFHAQPTMPSGKQQTTVDTEYQTNNQLIAYSLCNEGNLKGYAWNVRYSHKQAQPYSNAYDGRVAGSQFAERAINAMIGRSQKWGYTHLNMSAYYLTPSMIEGERDEETGQFIVQTIEDGEIIEQVATHKQLHTYDKAVPYQQVYHYKTVLDNAVYIGNGSLKTLLAYQHNRREEFEFSLPSPSETSPFVSSSGEEKSLDFMLHTINYDLHYLSEQRERWRYTLGMNGMYQRSLNRGEEVLIPEYMLFDMGLFATASWRNDKLNVSGGLRADQRHVHSFSLEDHFARFSRNFNAVSGSLGLVYSVRDDTNIRLNIAKGFRAPNLSELASNGEHEGTFRYEVGNSNLKAEHSWQADLGIDYSSAILSAQASLFANFIDNYIYAASTGTFTDDDMPVYAYSAGNARLTGAEIIVDLHPIEQLHFENTLSTVSTRLADQPSDRRHLPMTPPTRFTSELKYDIIRDGHLLNNTYVKAGMKCYARQNHCYTADDTETPTPGYTLFSLAAGTDIIRNRHTWATLHIIADNITDKAYQSHLSRLKQAPVNPVTLRQGVFNMGRNIVVKLQIIL